MIPTTKPYPNGASKDDESFSFMLQCINDVDGRTGEVKFECPLTQTGKNHHCEFDYIGHSMPYLYSEAVPGNHDHAWWVAGDREGYKAAYAFMYDKHPKPFGHDVVRKPGEGKFIARASVVRPLLVGYGKVNDKYMDEGERYYDGTIATEGGQEISEDAQKAALDPNFDYENYKSQGPMDIRVGLFRADGQIADIRDFTKVEVVKGTDGKPVGWFEFVEAKLAADKGGFRVSLVFVLRKNLKVQQVVYYDTQNDGQIAWEVNGKKLGEGKA